MTLAQWCIAVGSVRRYRRRIFKLIAFIGRYAHQQKPALLFDTTRELMELAYATNEILEEEKKQFDTGREPD